MKRDNPGNADYSFKDMAEYSPLTLHPRFSDNAANSHLTFYIFTRLQASKRSICCKLSVFCSYLHAILV